MSSLLIVKRFELHMDLALYKIKILLLLLLCVCTVRVKINNAELFFNAFPFENSFYFISG